MSIDRLCAYYGFSKMPFRKDLAPSALFRSTAHAEAVARLTWCIGEGGLAVVTGEVGSGKTVALRATAAGLEPSRHQVVYCPNPVIGGRGILAAIVTALGGVPRFHRSALVPQAAEALGAAEAERGRRVVVAIDEAHLLADDQLEDVRMLTSAELDSKSPAVLVLIGQPVLRRRLAQTTMAALDQRVSLRVQLEGMDPQETKGYLRHHLELCGRSDPLFSDDAIDVVHRASRGLPRALNNLAVQGLVAAFMKDQAIVDERAAKTAVVEVAGE